MNRSDRDDSSKVISALKEAFSVLQQTMKSHQSAWRIRKRILTEVILKEYTVLARESWADEEERRGEDRTGDGALEQQIRKHKSRKHNISGNYK